MPCQGSQRRICQAVGGTHFGQSANLRLSSSGHSCKITCACCSCHGASCSSASSLLLICSRSAKDAYDRLCTAPINLSLIPTSLGPGPAGACTVRAVIHTHAALSFTTTLKQGPKHTSSASSVRALAFCRASSARIFISSATVSDITFTT